MDLSAQGFRLEKPEGEGTANVPWTLVTPEETRIPLTTRQVQILTMPPNQRNHVPFQELYEMGKLFHDHMPQHIDQSLERMEEGREAPEFVPEP